MGPALGQKNKIQWALGPLKNKTDENTKKEIRYDESEINKNNDESYQEIKHDIMTRLKYKVKIKIRNYKSRNKIRTTIKNTIQINKN